MKKIKILNDFGVYELGNIEDVSRIVDSINIESNAEVELDLSGCLPDYPATSLIIDKIISQMRLVSGKKILSIVLEFSLPLETLANWLFLGSAELNIENDKSLSLDRIKSLIHESLEKYDIEIKIITNNNQTRDIPNENIFK